MGIAQAKKQHKLDSLYATAIKLFSDKGFSGTSIAEIAEKAGIAKGTFYLYFKDKYDLRDRLVAHYTSKIFDEAYNKMAAGCYEGFRNQFWALIENTIAYLEANPLVMKFISKDLSWGIFRHAVEDQYTNEMSEAYERYLGLLNENGVNCEHPDLMLFTIMELVGSTCNSCIVYQQPLTMREYLPWLRRSIDRIIDVFV